MEAAKIGFLSAPDDPTNVLALLKVLHQNGTDRTRKNNKHENANNNNNEGVEGKHRERKKTAKKATFAERERERQTYMKTRCD